MYLFNSDVDLISFKCDANGFCKPPHETVCDFHMPPSCGHLINMNSMPNTSIESFVVLESFAVLEGGRLGSGFEVHWQ